MGSSRFRSWFGLSNLNQVMLGSIRVSISLDWWSSSVQKEWARSRLFGFSERRMRRTQRSRRMESSFALFNVIFSPQLRSLSMDIFNHIKVKNLSALFQYWVGDSIQPAPEQIKQSEMWILAADDFCLFWLLSHFCFAFAFYLTGLNS